MDTLVRHWVLFMNRSSRRLFWFRFTGKHCFTASSTDFLIPAQFLCRNSVKGGGEGVVLRDGRPSPRHRRFASGFAFYQCGSMGSG